MLSSCLSVHLSQTGVVSKRLNRSRWFRYESFLPLCCKEIRLSPKIRVFPSATLSQIFLLELKNFARASQSCCQQSSRTVELVDHTYDGRRVARRTHTSVDRSALTALLRSRMGLLCTLFLQWCSSWQDFVWYSVSCSLSAVEELLDYSWYRGNVQTPGPLVLWL